MDRDQSKKAKGVFMKSFWRVAAIGSLCGLMVGGFEARAALEVSAAVQIHATADFEAPLTTCGTWVTVGSYGRCWHPTGVAVEWRPYCDGEWVWTDCGWYWQSDEPWAWACYHYGRWSFDAGFGWFWIPDVEWAPAWVYWRTGGGYIGWAPCPPSGIVIAPSAFAFVEVGHFQEHHRPRTVIVNNTTIINQTTIINNNIKHDTRTINGTAQKVVVNDGPQVETIQKATGRNVNRVPIRAAAERTRVPPEAQRSGGGDKPRDEKAPTVTPTPTTPANPNTPTRPPAETEPRKDRQPHEGQAMPPMPPGAQPAGPRHGQPGEKKQVGPQQGQPPAEKQGKPAEQPKEKEQPKNSGQEKTGDKDKP
jgi:hypothetical protein